ncbi:MAG TPA: diguanylate cyclase [Thermodesulfovibrionales bacterium]|nr:diguanylate cyclase [Thermodesulfovibrionales bacterium]
MLLKDETRIYRSFLISFCVVIALFIAGTYLGLNIETRKLIYESLRSDARAYFETIVATRAWNSNYGGVYVEKKGGVTSSPYIEDPDIVTKDGRVFTLRNPAIMTREVSEYIGKDKEFSFHITSTRPLNPENRPDEFEAQALDSFSKGEKEAFRTAIANGKMYFRYMGPLYVENSCLPCHAKQGYKVGDIRGGISVTFNIDAVHRKLQKNVLLIVLFAGATAALLIAIFWYLTRRLMRRLAEIRKQLEEMAVTDGLTGIHNRRYALQRFEEEFERARRLHKDLSCIMLDIDYFKRVNDEHGHLIGDEVLIEVAARIKASARAYDIPGRFGGEEFIVVMPETNGDDARGFAERIRDKIRSGPIKGINVTVSIGAGSSASGDTRIDDIIKRADDKLYEAKDAGRDCVR